MLLEYNLAYPSTSPIEKTNNITPGLYCKCTIANKKEVLSSAIFPFLNWFWIILNKKPLKKTSSKAGPTIPIPSSNKAGYTLVAMAGIHSFYCRSPYSLHNCMGHLQG